MADETQPKHERKMGLIRKVLIYALVGTMTAIGGFLYGKYSRGIKNLAIRDLNGDYNKADMIITHNDGNKEAFIQQDNGSYITWGEARRNMYKSIDDTVKKIEDEIKK